jgi:hypothetical protein
MSLLATVVYMMAAVDTPDEPQFVPSNAVNNDTEGNR